MIIDKNPPPKPKDPSDVKKKIIEDLTQNDDGLLVLAYMYAKDFALCGEDITKAWSNALINNQFVEDIYRRGYEDAVKDIESGVIKDFYHKATVDYEKKK